MILLITSSLAVLIDILVLSLSVSELVANINDNNLTITRPASVIFFDVINTLLVLSGIRLLVFVPVAILQQYNKKPLRFANIYTKWLVLNFILLIVGCFLLIFGGKIADEMVHTLLVILSMTAVICEHCYIRNARTSAHIYGRFKHHEEPLLYESHFMIMKSRLQLFTFSDEMLQQASLRSPDVDYSDNQMNDVISAINTISDVLLSRRPYEFLNVLGKLFEKEWFYNETHDLSRLQHLLKNGFSSKFNDSAKINLLIPQVLTYLLICDDDDVKKSLIDVIYRISMNDLAFSHRMYWFIKSFIDLKDWDETFYHHVQRFQSAIERLGEYAAQKVAFPASDILSSKHSNRFINPIFVSGLSTKKPSPDLVAENIDLDVFRRVGRLLMHDDSRDNKPLTNEATLEKEFLSPSINFEHTESDIEKQNLQSYLCYPIEHAKLPHQFSRNNPKYFHHTTLFWDRLCHLATLVFKGTEKQAQRTHILQQLLQDLVTNFMPTSCVYIPIIHESHRIWDIKIEECFAFSTKARSPLFICFEIIEYSEKSRPTRRKKAWWKIPGKILRESLDSLVEQGNSLAKSSSPEPSKFTNRQVYSQNINSSSAPPSKTIDQGIKSHTKETSVFKVEGDDIFVSEVRCSYGATSDTATPPAIMSSIDPSIIRDIDAGSSDIGQWTSPYHSPSPSMHVDSIHDRVTHSAPSHQTFVELMSQTVQHNITSNQRPLSPVGKKYNVSVVEGDDSNALLVDPYQGNEDYRSECDRERVLNHNSSTKQHAIMNEEVYRANLEINRIERSQSSQASIEYNDTFRASGKFRKRSSESFFGLEHGLDRGDIAHLGLTTPSESKESQGDEIRPSTPDIQPPIIVFKENWRQKQNRIRRLSPVGNCRGYRLVPVIVKSMDDLRQEQIVSQLLFIIEEIFLSRRVEAWIRPYEIIALSKDSGIIEAIPDTVSLNVLRRTFPGYSTLMKYFSTFYLENRRRFSTQTDEKCDNFIETEDEDEDEEKHDFIPTLQEAKENFLMSAAGYAIVCYLLQIKDRHNGNILLDIYGHIIHIDFGFVLGITPGGNIGFESAPFKLTTEMVEVLGGFQSHQFHRFRDLCVETFMALRKDHQRLVSALEMLMAVSDDLPMFRVATPAKVIEAFKDRFQVNLSDQDACEYKEKYIMDKKSKKQQIKSNIRSDNDKTQVSPGISARENDSAAFASSASMIPPDPSKIPHPAFNDKFDDGETE